jgi:hypothetical protein
MNKLANLPDIGGRLQQLDIQMKLEGVSDQSILGFSIRNALKKYPLPLRGILTMIMEQAKDNESAVMDVVGYDLYNQIKAIYERPTH